VAQAATMVRETPTPRRILIVDDNPDITSSLSMMLEAIGHFCHEAHDGLSALVGIDEFAPDLMLLDLAMPFMDGIEVAGRVRQLPGGEAITIVAITGNAVSDIEGDLREAGFNHCLTKPIGIDAIRELVGTGIPMPSPVPATEVPAVGPSTLICLMTAADEACAQGDANGLAAAMLPIVSLVHDDLAIDLVAVFELCRYDMELASMRWMNLRSRVGP
jgi:CheY-like chemotaxis protein